jgi:hypothetical protein
MENIKFALPMLVATVIIAGCASNSASVKTTTSPVDGKTRTIIQGSAFSTSYIYPVDGSSMLGMEIAGGSVIDKETASIIFNTMSDSGYRTAYFKADGEEVELTPTKAITDFTSSQYGVNAIKEFYISCSDIKKVAQSNDVYLRVTFSDGFVDYDVSKTKYGADGFGMIKKISQYCD